MTNPVRTARRALGLTQADLAKRLDVDRTSVVAWETGRYEPGPRHLPELARVLRVKPEALSRDLAAFKAKPVTHSAA